MLGVPLEMAEQNDDFDHDGDGCSDYQELGHDKVPPPDAIKKCGDDPYNPYDSDEDFDSVGTMLVTVVRQDIDKDTGAPIPGIYYQCIYDMQESNQTDTESTLDVTLFCYTDAVFLAVNPQNVPPPNANATTCPPAPDTECGDGDPGSPPPEPFGDVDDVHNYQLGTYDKQNNVITMEGCTLDEFGSQGHTYFSATVVAHTGHGTALIYGNQDENDCVKGTPTGTPGPAPIDIAEQAPKAVAPGAKGWDTDMDGCSDAEELGSEEGFGGLRDPYNKWDFYDINGDQFVNLFDDIIGVANAFGTGAVGRPNEDPAYSEILDRGGSLTGSNVWNQRPPDGKIDLFNDIFGVAFQFGHRCSV
jgi:hypothetical protein